MAEFMVKELRSERERSKLNIEQLTNLIDGGEHVTKRRREISEQLLVSPSTSSPDPQLLILS